MTDSERQVLEFILDTKPEDYEYGKAGFQADVIAYAASLGLSELNALKILLEYKTGKYKELFSIPDLDVLNDVPLAFAGEHARNSLIERPHAIKRQPDAIEDSSKPDLAIKNEPAYGNATGDVHCTTLSELQNQSIPNAGFLVQDIFPAVGVGVLGGAPKVGKSLFARMLAFDVVDPPSELFLGHKVNHSPVLYCDLENDMAGLKHITSRMLGDEDWFKNFYCLTRGELPTFERGGLETLRQHCVKYRPKLVVIDNYVCFRTPPSGQSLYDADYKSMDALRALALERQCFILALHHTTKTARGGDPAMNFNATLGLGAAANVILELRREPGGNRGTLTISGNTVPYQRIPLNFDAETLLWSHGENKVGRAPEKLEAAKSFLLEQLKTGPCSYDLLVGLTEEMDICSLRTLMSAKKVLGIRSKGRKTDMHWALPD